jgi:hypothetical protein
MPELSDHDESDEGDTSDSGADDTLCEPGADGSGANGQCADDASPKQHADAVDGAGDAPDPSAPSTSGVTGKKRGRKPGKKAAEGGTEKPSCKKAACKRDKQEAANKSASAGEAQIVNSDQY